MAKARVGDNKDSKNREEQPAININFSPPAEVGEIVTTTEPSKLAGQKEGQPTLTAQDKEKQSFSNLGHVSAQEILDKSEKELAELGIGKREARNLAQTFRIITAILLGKNKNKELAQTLDTDKSFVAKQVKELEQQGLVKKEEEGREVKYVVDSFNVMKFLQSKVVIKVKEKPKDFSDSVRESAQDKKEEGVQNGGRAETK